MTTAEGALPPRADARQPTFFGEPPALGYLAFTEAWERFSYYGMTALLVLYMSEQLFAPAHIGHVTGFAAFRRGLEFIVGPMSTVALASQMYGLYTGFVYFTPVFGGLIADRWLGRRNAVVLGAILMSMGHIAMAFDVSLLLALSLLIVGCGFLKGNISTQVGSLYAEDDGAGRTRGFSIFSIGINVGAVAGPLVCGALAKYYGWHAGFGLAGILMLAGLATYMAGYRHLQDAGVRQTAAMECTPPLTRRDWIVVAALIGTIALTIFQSIAYYQNANLGLLWIHINVNLDCFGFRYSRVLVQFDRFVCQHHFGAGSLRIVAMASRAWPRARRDRQDRDRRLDGIRRKSAPGSRLCAHEPCFSSFSRHL